MFKRSFVFAAAAAFAIATSFAADQPKAPSSNTKVVIAVDRVNPTDGKQMFVSYCAPCHGVDGRGAGPVASSLKEQPLDLTGLARMHNGRYPDSHVVSVLQFGSELPAHGNAQMPVWGPVLGKISNIHTQEKQLRIANLSRYLQSIQAK